MAYARVGVTSVAGSGNTSSSIDTTSANLLVVVLSYYQGVTDPPTLDDGSSGVNTFTLASTGVSSNRKCKIYYCYGPSYTSSTHTIKATGSVSFLSVSMAAYSGSTASPFDAETNNGSSAASTLQPGSLTPNQADSLLISGYSGEVTSAVVTVSGGSWSRITETHDGSNVNLGMAEWIQSGAGAASNPTWATNNGAGEVAICQVSFKPASGGGDVTVGLTGNAATGAVGTLGVAIAIALSGIAGTGAVGTVTTGASKAMTGNASAGSVGTVVPSMSAALTGAAGTGAVGTLTPFVTIGLTGNAATGAVGTVTSSGGDSGPVTVGITGNAATGAVGTVTPGVSAALTGVAGTGAVGTVTPGASVALTGTAGTGAVGTVVPSVTIALTGVAGTGAVGTVVPSGGVEHLLGNVIVATIGIVNVRRRVRFDG